MGLPVDDSAGQCVCLTQPLMTVTWVWNTKAVRAHMCTLASHTTCDFTALSPALAFKVAITALSLFCMIALWKSFKKGITFKILKYLFCSLLLEPAATYSLCLIENCMLEVMEMNCSVFFSWNSEWGLHTGRETWEVRVQDLASVAWIPS